MPVTLTTAFDTIISTTPGDIIYTVPADTIAEITKAVCTNDIGAGATAFNVKVLYDAGGLNDFVHERVIPEHGTDLVPEITDAVFLEGDVIRVYASDANRLGFYLAIREFT